MSVARRVAWLLVAAAATALASMAIMTPLDAAPQVMVGVAVLGCALLVRHFRGRLTAQILTLLSVLASSRYIWWRLSSTLDFDTTLDWVLGILLISAELYAFVILLLGAFQTVHVLERKPVPLPADRSRWPTVDVFIPTYNEPLEVVRPTVLAAQALDWPADKLRIHLLDDGCRAEFREMAARARVNYIVRDEHKHAKAGNLNHALGVTDGELIAIFDCDHVTTRSFLQLTVGWFVRDPRLGMLQTPHHFYNADPIERNLGQFRRVPNEGELFYSHVQSGNDFWNATFFCGSCALIRRAGLAAVGGIATGSVTEDALTSIELQRIGYRTAYLNVRQAAGLATDTLAAHIGQRVRWAQGMAQILRVSNPLLGRGLAVGQRLCYLNASLHFLYGLPRLIFLLGPLAYLLLGSHICAASPAMLLAYLLPHLCHAMVVDAHVRRRFRYAFWNNIYETVLAIYILVPTLTALWKPRAGVFKVTDKAVLAEGGFDRHIARRYLVMMLFVVAGIALALARLVLWEDYDVGTVLINLAWCTFSLFTLGAVLAVACESRQMRRMHRLPLALRAALRTASGHVETTQTRDLSLSGAAVTSHKSLAVGDCVELGIFRGFHECWFPARVVAQKDARLQLAFAPLTLPQESELVQLLFGRPDAWVDWERGRPEDRPLASLRTLVRESLRGIRVAASAERRLVGGALVAVTAISLAFLLSRTGWRVQPLWERAAALGTVVSDRLQSAADAR
jgi:cellulose synthase (UDP-forming)